MYLKKISEEILRRYEGGDPTSDSPIDRREIDLLVIQKINGLIKKEHFNINVPLGESVPPHASLATYDLTVVDTSNVTKVFTCTEISIAFDVDFWEAPNGQYYLDPTTGYYWLNKGDEGTLTITNTTGMTYTIVLSGVDAHTDTSLEAIVEFMTSTSEGYIELFGMTGSDVKRFDLAGISDLTETADGFSFTYDLAATEDSDDKIRERTQASHLALATDTGANSVEVVGVKKCLLTTNSTSDAKAQATLPTQPINLPRGMGVWRVYDATDPLSEFIPVQSGQYHGYEAMLGESLDLNNAYVYFDNKTLVFNKTAEDLPGSLKVQLVVVDPDEVSETDLLPIPADMEEQVIMEVLAMIQPQRPEDRIVDANETTR